MARVFKQHYTQTGPDGTKRKKQSRKWYVEYRDADRIRRRVPGYTDRKATEQLASELERQAARQQSGLVDRFAEHRKHPLSEHLSEWRESMLAKGTTEKHADLVRGRVRRIFNACRFVFWPEVSASKVQAHVADRRAQGLSIQSGNFYLQAAKQFCRWMVQDGRAPDNPLVHLRGGNARTDRRHDRRALSLAELRNLLAAAEDGPERFGMTGPERAMLYRVAAETGLRANELRSLVRANFSLDADPPTVTVNAAYSKHRREDTLPLQKQLAVKLRSFMIGKTPAAEVFHLPSAYNLVDMLRADLQGAGIAYRDDSGRVCDFHALRHTFITNLATAGVHPRLAQSLARHSTITLTMDRYTHTVIGEQAEALAALPDLSENERLSHA